MSLGCEERRRGLEDDEVERLGLVKTLNGVCERGV